MVFVSLRFSEVDLRAASFIVQVLVVVACSLPFTFPNKSGWLDCCYGFDAQLRRSVVGEMFWRRAWGGQNYQLVTHVVSMLPQHFLSASRVARF
ncbi:hypothetical protein Bca101_067267 [Brassica carinata]